MPAVANAVYDAVGVRIDEVPITPEKILKALEAKAAGKPARYGPAAFPGCRLARAAATCRRRGKAATAARERRANARRSRQRLDARSREPGRGAVMMRLPRFTFHAPRTVREAAELLAAAPPGDAMLVAGGTDLLPNMKRRQQVPRDA